MSSVSSVAPAASGRAAEPVAVAPSVQHEDWILMVDAARARLRMTVDALSVASLDAAGLEPVQRAARVVLECVDALVRLQAMVAPQRPGAAAALDDPEGRSAG